MAANSRQIFQVDPATHLLGNLTERFPRLLQRVGAFETRMLEDRLGPVDRPVYIAGLARAGSTLLLELVARQKGAVSHRYRDFPLLHTPYLWNRYLDLAGAAAGPARERAHRDGLVVDRDSPEAFEEVLWMSFFPVLHDPNRSAVLDADTRNPPFERFYEDHLRKLLWLREGDRYVSKGNYNVTRLEYLHRLFPDARFVVPIRDPGSHVASLMRQHALFSSGQRANPRAVTHLRRVGHFEFGVDRRPIHTGDEEAVAGVRSSWERGRELEGWARYWSLIYGHIAERLERNPSLAAATRIMSLEALCARPAVEVPRLLQHCGFDAEPAAVEGAVRFVSAPGAGAAYRSLGLAERALVERLTRETWLRLARLRLTQGGSRCVGA